MIEFTTVEGHTIFVNPTQVVFVKQYSSGSCEISFTNGMSEEVEGSDVRDKITLAYLHYFQRMRGEEVSESLPAGV